MSMETVKARLERGPSRMGWSSYWLVDEGGRRLHTEPVCAVPDGWHPWFERKLQEMETEYFGRLD